MPKPRLGIGLLYFGAIYLGVMVLRYALRMFLYPHERWVGGSIPIFFHWDLAAFLLVLGYYHWSSSQKTEANHSSIGSSLGKRIIRWLLKYLCGPRNSAMGNLSNSSFLCRP